MNRDRYRTFGQYGIGRGVEVINVLFLVNYDQLGHSFAGPVLPLYRLVCLCVWYCLTFLNNKTKQNIILLKNTSIPRAEHKCYIGI